MLRDHRLGVEPTPARGSLASESVGVPGVDRAWRRLIKRAVPLPVGQSTHERNQKPRRLQVRNEPARRCVGTTRFRVVVRSGLQLQRSHARPGRPPLRKSSTRTCSAACACRAAVMPGALMGAAEFVDWSERFLAKRRVSMNRRIARQSSCGSSAALSETHIAWTTIRFSRAWDCDVSRAGASSIKTILPIGAALLVGNSS